MSGVAGDRRTLTRRRVAARIAVIARTDPDDPRLPALRERADVLHVAKIAEWARLAAAALPPPTHEEILAIGREVAAARRPARGPAAGIVSAVTGRLSLRRAS